MALVAARTLSALAFAVLAYASAFSASVEVYLAATRVAAVISAVF